MRQTFLQRPLIISAALTIVVLGASARQPESGYRFNWGRKVGINVGVGYTLDAYRYESSIVATTPEGYQTWVPTGEHHNWTQSSFTFRVGIDF